MSRPSISIETRSGTDLSQMDFRDELRQLLADGNRLYFAWRYAPRRCLGLWILAVIRCFTWHPQNNRFRKVLFLAVTGLVGTLLIGQSGFGWELDPLILFPVVAVWLVGFGVMLGFEVQRIQIAGWELDISYGEVSRQDDE